MKGNFYENERVALFIDGANLYSAARAWASTSTTAASESLSREGPAGPRLLLHGAGRGSGILADPAADRLAGLQRLHHGTKPTKEFTDAMGRRKIKGNMDIELAIDVLEMAEHLDHVILFSGDGDFRRLVEAVQRGPARLGGQHHQVLAADGGRRAAPPGRRLHRAVRAAPLIARNPVGAHAAPAVAASNGHRDADDYSGDAPAEHLMRTA
jgi:Uncharacterized conserved protein